MDNESNGNDNDDNNNNKKTMLGKSQLTIDIANKYSMYKRSICA